MRILTSWSDLQAGDKVGVVEVGGDFATGAIVRNVNRGTDHITRVGIEFLENSAPDRLVGTADRKRPAPSGSGPQNSARGSGPQSPARISGPQNPPRISGPQNPPRNSGPQSSWNSPPPPPPPQTGNTSFTQKRDRPSGRNALLAAAKGPEGIRDMVTTAKRLTSESKLWEALECLARAQELAQGTPEANSIRILIAETQAKNPALSRVAQQNLEDLARGEPMDVPVHSALGRIYWNAGLVSKAIDAFGHVLELEPGNREASDALAALHDSDSRLT
jgi:hypothetical protein